MTENSFEMLFCKDNVVRNPKGYLQNKKNLLIPAFILGIAFKCLKYYTCFISIILFISFSEKCKTKLEMNKMFPFQLVKKQILIKS